MHFSLLVECFVMNKVICVHTKDNPQLQEAYLWGTRDLSPVNWDEFVHYHRRANVVYEAGMF